MASASACWLTVCFCFFSCLRCFELYICFVVDFEHVLWQWISCFCPPAIFRQWMFSKIIRCRSFISEMSLNRKRVLTIWRGLSCPTLTSSYRSLLGWRNTYFCLVNIYRITYSVAKPCSEHFTKANSWFILTIILMPMLISSSRYCIICPRFHCC